MRSAILVAVETKKLKSEKSMLIKPACLIYYFFIIKLSILRYTVLSTFFTIAELAPVLKKKFVLLQSIWIFPGEKMKSEAFAMLTEALDDLSTRGFDWTHPSSKEHITSRAFLLFVAADRRVRNVMQCLDACSYCEHPGCELEESEQRVYPFTGQHEMMRTHANVLRNAFKFRNEVGNIEKGVLGCSPLMFLSSFNIVDGFSAEYQNNVLMAVVKNVLKLCLSESSKDEDYHLKVDGVAADRLKTFSGQMPSYEDGQQSGLDNVGNWTATECRNWLLFYSVPCLHQVWPEPIFLHHQLLVTAVYELLRDRICKSDLAVAEFQLELYCREFSGHFGASAMTLDVHNLLHLVRSVRQCGPLWSSSAFPFRQSQEFISDAFCRLESSPAPEALKNLSERINEHSSLQLVCSIQDQKHSCILSGEIVSLKPALSDYLENIEKVDMKRATFYSRMKINEFVLDTNEENKAGTAFFQYRKTGASRRMWAKLLCLCNYVDKDGAEERFLLASSVIKAAALNANVGVDHMTTFAIWEAFPIWLKVKDIEAPLFLLGEFLCAPPNMQEFDL